MKQNQYPPSQGVRRPFRLWNAGAKKAMLYRNYKHVGNAHRGAIDEMLYAKVGVCIEVYDARNGRELGQYVRTQSGADFYPPIEPKR